jgi:hypothetical protein
MPASISLIRFFFVFIKVTFFKYERIKKSFTVGEAFFVREGVGLIVVVEADLTEAHQRAARARLVHNLEAEVLHVLALVAVEAEGQFAGRLAAGIGKHVTGLVVVAGGSELSPGIFGVLLAIQTPYLRVALRMLAGIVGRNEGVALGADGEVALEFYEPAGRAIPNTASC